MADEAAAPTGPQTRAFSGVVDDVSKGARTVTAKINTSIVDRYRTVILPSGGTFANFTRAPAVLWEHGADPTRGRQPIGHCSSIKYRRVEDDILAVTQFKTDEYSSRIFDDYVSGTLTSFSVDFLPDFAACGRPSPEELRARPDWATAECVFRKWDLGGYSAVSYAGNPEALAVAVERGLWVPDEVRRSLPAPKRDMAEGSGSTGGYATETKAGRHVCERDGKWCVCDGDTVVSRHDTEAEANAALDPPAEPPADRTAPPPPADSQHLNIRTYTVDELIGLTSRSVVDHLLALTVQSVRDADDLARGRV
jgi:hypothetical protein